MPYTGTSLYLHFDGEDNQTTTVDSSGSGHTVVRTGLSVLDTAEKTIGTSSAYFPAFVASSNYWAMNTLELFGVTSLTIQFDVKFETSNGGQNYFYYENQNAFAFIALYYDYADSLWHWRHTNGPVHLTFGAWSPSLGTWYRVRLEWTGAAYTLKIDGTSLGSAQNNALAFPNLSAGVIINDNLNQAIRYFQGWIDEYIIFPGILAESPDVPGTPVDGATFCTYVSQGTVRKMVTNVTGLDHLEGERVSVQADGIPEDSQTYTVVSGQLNNALPEKAAVIHVGLPYTGTIKLLKASDGNPAGTGQMKMRRLFLAGIRVFRSLGFKIGLDIDHLSPVILGKPTLPLTTGDLDKIPNTTWTKAGQLIIIQDKPQPVFIEAIITQSEVEKP